MRSSRYQINEQEVDSVADQLLGKPFERGARGPDRYDCFGLLSAIFLGCGIDLDDPFRMDSVDSGAFRRFRALFRRLSPGQALERLDVIKQKRQQAHVSIYLSRGYALDTFEFSLRVPIENIQPFVTGIWRYRCLAEL